MNTADTTLKSSSGSLRPSTAGGQSSSKRRRRQTLQYTPGALISDADGGRKRRKTRRPPALPWVDLHSEITDQIVIQLARDREAFPIMMLSMVNRTFRREVQGNLKAWHMLYLHWRGHLSCSTNSASQQPPMSRLVRSPSGIVVKLNPSIPRSLPNFHNKTPSIG
jgi:hypothetical protein